MDRADFMSPKADELRGKLDPATAAQYDSLLENDLNTFELSSVEFEPGYHSWPACKDRPNWKVASDADIAKAIELAYETAAPWRESAFFAELQAIAVEMPGFWLPTDRVRFRCATKEGWTYHKTPPAAQAVGVQRVTADVTTGRIVVLDPDVTLNLRVPRDRSHFAFGV
jgi:hypothetical protein